MKNNIKLKQEEKNISPDEALFNNGIIMLHEDIDECTSSSIITELGYFALKEYKNVKIYLSSPGGDVFYGLAIFDYIRSLTEAGIKVYTIGQGLIASMGSILLQAGSTRVMQKNAWLMMHEILTLSLGKTSDIVDEAKLLKRLEEESLLQILCERSKLTQAQLKKKWLRKDWWMSSGEALKYGFIDELV